MKSIRVTPNEKIESKFITLFTSVEAAHSWAVESKTDPTVINFIQDVEKLELKQDEFMEVEWMGCEFTRDEHEDLRFDYVRMAKARPAKNSSGILVTVHAGWTCDRILPFKDYADDTMTVTKLTAESAKLNLSVIFKDNEKKSTLRLCKRVTMHGTV